MHVHIGRKLSNKLNCINVVADVVHITFLRILTLFSRTMSVVSCTMLGDIFFRIFRVRRHHVFKFSFVVVVNPF